MESKIFREIDGIKEIVYHLFKDEPRFKHDRHCHSWCSLAAFSYGPEPKDWKFTWELQWEEMVGQFWELIDNPPLKLPGAWVD
ncbi:hypothetical protein LMH87_002746 [Akanthomyces muscarius]|uniref:Uncharacterized protein n=1 Tax=Akanthomyces muscarius TaxID=2231603 RepID=A0A9W8UJK0_AKAMU|nr:hypothetical protein LMH87_002746 [Akanthomyces muscarius]KAJ4148267.1 hypothetical protein LMH87_002746 [Akanthomyces muscarius]